MYESLIIYQTIRFLFLEKGGGWPNEKPSKKKDAYGSYFNCEWEEPPEAATSGEEAREPSLPKAV